jgi:hypothetical protein
MDASETQKIGINFQSKYWLGTSVFIHPQRPQPNSGVVKFDFLTGIVTCRSRQVQEQGAGSPEHVLALPWHLGLRVSKEIWPVAEVNNGLEAAVWCRVRRLQGWLLSTAKGQGGPCLMRPERPVASSHPLHPSQQTFNPSSSDHKGWNLITWELLTGFGKLKMIEWVIH